MPSPLNYTTDGLDGAALPPDDLLVQVHADAETVVGEAAVEPLPPGAIGVTMFDLPGSEDNTVTVLLPQEHSQKAPSQSLVRIKSRGDGRTYLGIIAAGPFAEPDNLRGDSHLLVTVNTRGGLYLPPYHGRVQVSILGEELPDGGQAPPRLRPMPNSPVFVLDAAEAAKVLRSDGDIRLGMVVGQEEIVVGVPSDRKSVLPRHLGILGTTGGGKSTTVSRLTQQLQKAGVATVLIDVEGEYTEMDRPTDDPAMITALELRGIKPEGVENFAVGHLVGRETSRDPSLKKVRPFSMRFCDLSPYVVMEILDLEQPQQDRFLKAYDATKQLLKDLHIFPKPGEEHQALEMDELEEGYPRMKLEHLLDVVGAFTDWSGLTRESRKRNKDDEEDDVTWGATLRSPDFAGQDGRVKQRIVAAQAPKIQSSWKSLVGKLWRLKRLQIFDNPQAPALDFKGLIRPGGVTVIDLSDTDSPHVNNLLIADVLRNIQRQQEENFRKATEEGKPPTPVVVIIEEAHEFLSEQRVKQMPVLFQQVARIAKRGRKRWLGLVFVTQLPQHLPNEVLGLINNYIVHKIADGGVVDRLRKSISGIDKGLWNKVSGLAPGQALVSLTSMARPLLVSIDPTPCRLQLVE
jgi:uncharacterized protein